jgi:hypothetical protein
MVTPCPYLEEHSKVKDYNRTAAAVSRKNASPPIFFISGRPARNTPKDYGRNKTLDNSANLT